MSNKSSGSEDKDLKKIKASYESEGHPHKESLINHEDAAEFSEVLYERMNIIVDKGQEPVRLDKFLTARIENISRNKVQQAIEGGRVLVNNKTASPNYKIRPGDNIVSYSDRQIMGEEIIPEKMPLNIFYEDDEVLIINKAPGMVVHPASGNYSGTLINGVAFYLQEKNQSISEETLPRFGLVHRIDKNTSGLLVLAKTSRAVASLAKQFFDHSIKREYLALVWGDITEEHGTILAHVGRHQRYRKIFEAYPEGEHGKEAITHYEVVERFGYTTLVRCILETGRTHQIRVHMKYIGHPLFSDETYGGDKILKGTIFNKYKQFVENCFLICPRQALHAKTLGFKHPATGKDMLFDSELPNDMREVIEKWRTYSSKPKT